jgi:FAD-linked oxidoreductase
VNNWIGEPEFDLDKRPVDTRPMTRWANWAGTVSAQVTPQSPSSISALQECVAKAAETGTRIKPIGAGHSFTDIGATDGIQIRPEQLAGVLNTDRDSGRVTVLAGTRLHELNQTLWDLGLSMANLGDIDVQTVAGAISTGTHGTGVKLGGIATQVCALQLILADGSLRDVDPISEPELFAAARVGLGALGVIATVTLQCVPAFGLEAHEAPAALDAVLAELDSLIDGNDHFEFFWFPHTRGVLTKSNNRIPQGAPLRPLGRVRQFVDEELLANTVFDALNRLTTRRPALIPRANRVATRLLSDRQYSDRSYRVFASPRRVKFREMEYAVPRAAVPVVLAEIDAYLARSGEQIGFPVEVRFAAGDDIWLSTANGRDTGYLAVHQYHRREHETYFAAVEAIARSVDGRPHWGKLHNRDAASLATTYPDFAKFVALRDRLDPKRLFANPYLDRVLGT